MPGIEFGRGENEEKFRICNAHMPWVPIGSEWAIYKLYVFFCIFIFIFDYQMVLQASIPLHVWCISDHHGLKHLNMKSCVRFDTT